MAGAIGLFAFWIALLEVMSIFKEVQVHDDDIVKIRKEGEAHRRPHE